MDFFHRDSIFFRGTNLLKGSIYTDIIKKETFFHLRSVFDAQWYNFVVPIIGVDEFNWKEANEVVKVEELKNKKISYYVHAQLIPGYRPRLQNLHYTDFARDSYMFAKLDKRLDNAQGKLVPIDKDNSEEYFEMAVKCFPEWDEEKEYSEYFLNLEKKKTEKEYHSYLLEVDGKNVSFGSVIISPEHNLSYLHNAGTLPEYRRRGYFSALNKHLCNLSLDKGVNEIFGLVEKTGPSYFALQKLGFKPLDTFYLFGREDEI